MYTVGKTALSLAVLVLVASVGLAQGRGFPGLGGATDGPVLILNKSVQDELKLNDDQKADLKKIADKQAETIQKIFEDLRAGGTFDRDKIQEAMKKIQEDANKAVAKTVDGLKDDQKKRFKQIQVQVKGIRAFSDDELTKDLKLTDKQKDDIKEQTGDLTKDIAEIFKDLPRGDAKAREEAQKKVADLTKMAMDKITGSLTDAQKKTWKDMNGEKFDLKMDAFPGFPGKDKGKGDKTDKF